MNPREDLRELLKELEDAIHDALARSEQIAESVQRLREAGADVYLIVDASLTLNSDRKSDHEESEVAVPVPTQQTAEPAGEAQAPAPWSGHDLQFLRELRIRID